MNRNVKLASGLLAVLLMTGCQSNQVIEGALNGALGSVASSTGILGKGTGTSTRNDDFLSPGHARNNCRYNNDNKCAADFGKLEVTHQRNREGVTLVRYGNLIEGASGGMLKESRVSEQMFPYIDGGFIAFERNIYISKKARGVRPGKYYFKGQYGNQDPQLAVGDITIKPGVTNLINVTYD